MSEEGDEKKSFVLLLPLYEDFYVLEAITGKLCSTDLGKIVFMKYGKTLLINDETLGR